MNRNSKFQRYFLPGFIFQSLLIGGGYATGRELVQFFLMHGPLGGLFGILFAALCFSIVSLITFEFARITKSYNYRAFFRSLIGRWWWFFELAFVLLAILILGVIGSAAGEVVSQHLGIDSKWGTVSLMVLIGLLVFFGTWLIERVLAGWSFLLYFVYGIFVLLYLFNFGQDFVDKLVIQPVHSEWLMGSIKYFGYNVAALPLMLFCAHHMESRKDAVISGILAGPIAMIPALLLYLAMVASYPVILDSSVPSDYMMQQLNITALAVIFYIVMFGTFVETGTACIHAINERLDDLFRERKAHMPQWLRPLIALIALLGSIVLAQKFGLIELIANGYGTLTWAFMVIYVVPLLTYGVYKTIR